MNGNFMPQSRRRDIVVQELHGEILIYDLAREKAHCLNETAARIWNLCGGNASVAEIARELSRTTKQPIAEDLVWLALQQLEKENLLENSREIAEPLGGVSRRETIKRIGLTSMIVLPTVLSLVAPTAAQVQSPTGLPDGAPSSSVISYSCTCPVDCASTQAARDNDCNVNHSSQCASKTASSGPCTQVNSQTVTFTCQCGS